MTRTLLTSDTWGGTIPAPTSDSSSRCCQGCLRLPVRRAVTIYNRKVVAPVTLMCILILLVAYYKVSAAPHRLCLVQILLSVLSIPFIITGFLCVVTSSLAVEVSYIFLWPCFMHSVLLLALAWLLCGVPCLEMASTVSHFALEVGFLFLSTVSS